MKDLYDLFNDIRIDESEFEEMDVNDFEKAKYKRKFRNSIKGKNNWRKRSIAAAAVIIVSTATFGVAFPTYAKNIPIVGDIFRTLDNGRTGIYDKFKENSSELNIAKESNGIKMTVNDAIFDGRTINFTYTIETNKDLGEEVSLVGDIKVKGEELTGSTGSSHIVKVSENTYIGQENRTLSNLIDNPKDSINFKLKFNNISNITAGKEIKGKWDFDINLKAIKGESQAINESVKKDGVTASVNEVSINPMSLFISYSQKVNEEITENWDNIYLDIDMKDDLGNSYSGQGNGGSGTGNENMTWSKTFEKLKEGATKLIITPRLELRNGSGGAVHGEGHNEVPVQLKHSNKKERKDIVLDDIIVDINK